MPAFTFTARGRYTEAEMNRNVLFFKAPNANSRTLRVTIKNIDDYPHQYLVDAVTGMWNWAGGPVTHTYATVSLNPGEVREVDLDVANGTITLPNPNATYSVGALNVFVDNATTADVVIWPLWALDVTSDKVAFVTYGKIAKYTIQGRAKTSSGTVYFYIIDMANGDYVPLEADMGLLIAISPFDRTAAAADITSITSRGAGTYSITLQPITTGYLKVGVDIVVNYNALGNYLGTMMSWLTLLGADAVKIFLSNKYIQYLLLSQINPLLTHYFGAQNITTDAYIDPNDPTKVHIVLYTYYNVSDDPGWVLIAILAAVVAFAIGAVSISWAVVNVAKADVQKAAIQYMQKAESDFYSLMTNPNLPFDQKLAIASYYRAVANSITQLTGVAPCAGLAIGNTCIPWWLFAVIAAVLALILVLKR